MPSVTDPMHRNSGDRWLIWCDLDAPRRRCRAACKGLEASIASSTADPSEAASRSQQSHQRRSGPSAT